MSTTPYNWIARTSGMAEQHVHTGFHDHDCISTITHGAVSSEQIRDYKRRMMREY